MVVYFPTSTKRRSPGASWSIIAPPFIVIDRRRLRASLSYPQPPPLTIGEQAARDGLDEESVREAQTFKVTNVRFNEDESIAGFEHVIRTRAADAMSDAAPSQPNA